ncbi:MAG: nitrite reductase, copper-containing [Gammaproteobacteria bacterium]|nr:nitrite reductase, copper-containing [Gammaproteobacteria bacterium]
MRSLALILSICAFVGFNTQSAISQTPASDATPTMSGSGASPNNNPDRLKHVVEQLVAPPRLPEHEQVASGGSSVVEVTLTVQEKKLQIAPDATIWAMTYNGTVPGPMIVVHQDDYVQITLVNPSTNTLIHNVDFHAATGAEGGATMTTVAPGQQVTVRWKAIKPGVFVYHCAPGGLVVPLHVVLGMNGAIMVLPRDGLKDENGNPVHYDKAYYIAEQDYYVSKDENGNYKKYNSPAEAFGDMIQLFKTLKPSHIVFNGIANSLTGDHALTANVGDKVLFITSQANRDTRLHLIGGHADLVWLGGSFSDKPATDYESWPVVGGSAVAMLYQFREPGTYLYLNHNLIEAFAFDARAEITVKGEWNDDLMKQVSPPRPLDE